MSLRPYKYRVILSYFRFYQIKWDEFLKTFKKYVPDHFDLEETIYYASD
jgi:hypothetical protein